MAVLVISNEDAVHHFESLDMIAALHVILPQYRNGNAL
jgi:hypothetical protein